MSAHTGIESEETLIQQFYLALHRVWGPQNWWPAETPFEVIVGAFLTQNTAWTNVERAITNLRVAEMLTIPAMREVPLGELEQLVRPAGYFRQKASRLKNFVAFLDSQYQGSLEAMFEQQTNALRRELLALNGVGPETADSILLYAGNHPVFVVDAYTRRIAERHGITPTDTAYDDIRFLFERALGGIRPTAPNTSSTEARTSTALPSGAAHSPSPVSRCTRAPFVQVCNEMHAFIVGLGKNHCLKRDPQCEGCPLQRFLQLESRMDAAKPLTAGLRRTTPTSATRKSLK